MMSSSPKYLVYSLMFILFIICKNAHSAFIPLFSKKDIKVELVTSKGKIVILLHSKTIKHRDNFIKLINNGFYDGVLFHRVINGFMAQAGDPNSKNPDFKGDLGNQSEGKTISAEFYKEYYHKKGALAAARMGDQVNPLKESSGSQFYLVQGQVYSLAQLQQIELKINSQKERALVGTFFNDPVNSKYLQRLEYCKQNNFQDSINILVNEIKPLVMADQPIFKFSDKAIQDYSTVGGTPFLDGGYTVFGLVVEGLDVIDEICSSPTSSGDRPKEDVVIISSRILNKIKCLKRLKKY